MPKTISEQLAEVYHNATMSYARGTLKTEQELSEFETIHQSAAEQEEELTRRYHDEYDMRVDAVRQRLYDKAAHRSLDHPAPSGGGNDRARSIDHEAHRLVRLAHEADLQGAQEQARQAVEDLLESARRRDQTQRMAVDAFRQVHDRRSGQDRRHTIKHSQD